MTNQDTRSKLLEGSNSDQRVLYSFKKQEKLCYKRSFDTLFTHRHSFNRGGLWVIYFLDLPEDQVTFPMMVAFAVPKRNFKKAVTRNLLKRRLREAYRLNKHSCLQKIQAENRNVGFLIKYNGKAVRSFKSIEKDMIKVFDKLESFL